MWAKVIICSMTNDAVAEHIAGQQRIQICCAGTDGQFSMDDVVTAGAVINRLKYGGQPESDL